jgi:hypothetical protein
MQSIVEKVFSVDGMIYIVFMFNVAVDLLNSLKVFNDNDTLKHKPKPKSLSSENVSR